MQLQVYSLKVSEKTTWIFLRLTDDAGREGVGEATLNARTDDVLSALSSSVDLISTAHHSIACRLRTVRQNINGVVGRAIASGIEQAALDLEGKRTGRPVHHLLGGAYRSIVHCYANINRGTLSRRPEEFAERAARAVSEGYRAIKLAPFDDVTPEAADPAARDDLIRAGLARIESVTKQLADTARTQVDCHSRFRLDELETMLGRIADLNVAWFEEPVSENTETLDAIAALKIRADAKGIVLAGAEKCADLADFLPFIVRRCYRVVMPDIILAGGPSEVVRIGYLAAAHGVEVSPHNPCGPVMDMHSVHAAAALPSCHSLERQYREDSVYDDVVVDRAHRFENGAYTLSNAPGLGLAIDWTHPSLTLRQTHTLAFDLSGQDG